MATKTPWIKHLDKFKKANPKMSHKEAQIEAKATYKKPKSKNTKASKSEETVVPHNRRSKRGVTSN